MENAVLHLEEVIKDNLTLMHFERRVELAKDYYDYYTGAAGQFTTATERIRVKNSGPIQLQES